MALEAGSVFVRLSGMFNRDGFDKFDAAIGKADAKSKPGIVTKLTGKVDDSPFAKYSAMLDAYDRKTVTAKLGVDGAQALSKLRELELREKDLKHQIEQPKKFGDIRTAAAITSLKIVQEEAKKTQREIDRAVALRGIGGGGLGALAGRGGGGIGGAAGGLSSIGPAGLSPLTAAAVGGAPGILGLVGGAAGLIGSAGAGALGAGALGAGALGAGGVGGLGILSILKPTETQIKNVTKAYEALKKAQAAYGADSLQAAAAQKKLNAATAEGGKPLLDLVKRATQFGEAWQKATRVGQKAILAIADEGLKTADRLLPAFSKVANNAAKSLQRGLEPVFKFFRSKEFQGDLKILGDTFGKSIGPALQGALNLFRAFLNVAKAASPFVTDMAKGFERWTRGVLGGTENAKKLRSEIGGLVSQFNSWLSLAGDLSKLLIDFFGSGAKSGQSLVDSLDKIVKSWDKWVNSKQGQKDLKSFFDDSNKIVRALAGAIGGLIPPFVILVRNLMPLFIQFLKDLRTPLGIVAGGVKILGDGIEWANKKVPGFHQLVTAFVTLGIAVKALKWVGVLGGLDQVIKGYKGLRAAVLAAVAAQKAGENATLGQKIFNAVLLPFRKLGGALRAAVGTAKRAFVSAMEGIASAAGESAAGSAARGLRNKLRAALNAVKGALKSVLTGLFSGLGESAGETAASTASGKMETGMKSKGFLGRMNRVGLAIGLVMGAAVATEISDQITSVLNKLGKIQIPGTKGKSGSLGLGDLLDAVNLTKGGPFGLVGRKVFGLPSPGQALKSLFGGATGGLVTEGGIRYMQAGGPVTDTVPAMLTPGEFVMKKPAVDRVGAPALHALNRGGPAVNVSGPLGQEHAKTKGAVDKLTGELLRISSTGRRVTQNVYTDFTSRFKKTHVDVEKEVHKQRDDLTDHAAKLTKDTNKQTDKLHDHTLDQFKDVRVQSGKEADKTSSKLNSAFKGAASAVEKHAKSIQSSVDRHMGASRKDATAAASGLASGTAGSFGSLDTAIGSALGYIERAANAALKGFSAKPLAFTLPKLPAISAHAQGGTIPGATTRQDDHMVVGPGGAPVAMISGTEGILTRHQMPEVNEALSLKKAMGMGQYGSLYELWSGVTAPHHMAAGGWIRTGATIDPTQGQAPTFSAHGGFSFAELLEAGTNAGMRPDLTQLLGLRRGAFGAPMESAIQVRMPGRKRAFTIYKNDVGSGQPGNKHFTVDLHSAIANALGWHPNQDIEVARAGTSPDASGSGNIDPINLKGRGPLRTLGQAVLDKVRGAANGYINSHQPNTGGAGFGGVTFGKGDLKDYAFPLAAFASEQRVDRGQDMESRLNYPPMLAFGPGSVSSNSGDFLGTRLRLNTGPFKGHEVFYGHNTAPGMVRRGQSMTAGSVIAKGGNTSFGGDTKHVEIGFMEGSGAQSGSWSGPGSLGGMMMHRALHAMAPQWIGARAMMQRGGLIPRFQGGGPLAASAARRPPRYTPPKFTLPKFLGNFRRPGAIPGLADAPIGETAATFIGSVGLSTEGLPPGLLTGLARAGSIPGLTKEDVADRQVQFLENSYTRLEGQLQQQHPDGLTQEDIGRLTAIRQQELGILQGEQGDVSSTFSRITRRYGTDVSQAATIRREAVRRINQVARWRRSLELQGRRLTRHRHKRQLAAAKAADAAGARMSRLRDKLSAIQGEQSADNVRYNRDVKRIREKWAHKIAAVPPGKTWTASRKQSYRNQMNRELAGLKHKNFGHRKGAVRREIAKETKARHKLAEKYRNDGWAEAWAYQVRKWKVDDWIKKYEKQEKDLVGTTSLPGVGRDFTGGEYGLLLKDEGDLTGAAGALLERATALPDTIQGVEEAITSLQGAAAGAGGAGGVSSADIAAAVAADVTEFGAQGQSLFQTFGSNFLTGRAAANPLTSGAAAQLGGIGHFGAAGPALAQAVGQQAAGGAGGVMVQHNYYQTGPDDPHLHAQTSRFEFQQAFG